MDIPHGVLNDALRALIGFKKAYVTDIGTVAIEFSGSMISLNTFLGAADIMEATTGRDDFHVDVAIVDGRFLLIFS